MAGDDCVKQQDVSHLDDFDSVSGISLCNIRLKWNLDEQTTHEGVNISTQFVTKAGERLQEDEHILADDSSGHATLIIVKTDGAVNVEKVATSLALCGSCYRLVGEKGPKPRTKEIRSCKRERTRRGIRPGYGPVVVDHPRRWTESLHDILKQWSLEC